MLQNSILLGKCWKHKYVLFLSCPETKPLEHLREGHVKKLGASIATIFTTKAQKHKRVHVRMCAWKEIP